MTPPDDLTDHLTPEAMSRAQRHLVAKILAETAHERMVVPAPIGPGAYRVDAGGSTYSFDAEVLPLEHWVIDEPSIRRTVGGDEAPLDAQALVAELADRIGLTDELMPIYLEELAATLASAAWKLTHSRITAAELLEADFQQIEAAMTEGHPGFIANNGRIGFGAADHAAYSPEAGRAVRLLWVGVRRGLSRLSLGEGLTEDDHYRFELGEEWLASARDRLAGLGEDPDDYLLMPVHPWQWDNRLAVTFAPDVARRDLVLLGQGPHEHQAQQSIRTFWNRTDPTRSYTKVALSIQNMGFLRGLSPEFMTATPAINDFVAGLVHGEPELQVRGFSVLRERAAIGYTGDAYHATGRRSGWTRMTAALWRESPVDRVGDGERLATMASLLHRDAAGTSYVSTLVDASGLPAAEWVRRLLDAYVRPIVHCLARWNLAFMPHTENLVLVLGDHAVRRVIMKDVGEEVALLAPVEGLSVPEECARIAGDYPQEMHRLALHTDVFDGVLRHLAGILHADRMLDADEFWAEVAECLQRHAEDHPELAEALARYDFAGPTFPHSCLNRLQLRNTREMVDLGDQASSLMFAGELDNPIAGRAPVSAAAGS